MAHSIELDLDYEARTLPAVWEARVAERGDARCLWFPDRGEETWATLDRRVRSVAAGLSGRGIAAGDRVCLRTHNSPETIVLMLALWRLGAVVAPISPQLTGPLLEERLRLVGPRLTIGDPALVAELEVDAEAPAAAARPADPALILFTSGSSGAAKGCLVSHHYAVYYGWVFWRYMGYRETDTLYTCLPLNHCHALFASWWASVLAGGALALSGRFSASRYWREVAESEATSCSAIGMMTSVLLSRPADEWESRLKVRIAHVSAEGALAMPEFEARFGFKTVSSRYGSTEAMVFPPVLDLPPVPGLIGPEPADWDIALLDRDGRPVADGAAGELAIRPRLAQIMFDAYLERPEATVEAFRGLWFHTGDLARRDALGLYWFVGRVTDTIRRRGENISAWEVERIVAQLPAVTQAAAFALPSTLSGEDLCLAVAPAERATLTVAELERHCEESLPRYMRPDRIWVRADLPKTSSNKVDKARLRAEYGEEQLE